MSIKKLEELYSKVYRYNDKLMHMSNNKEKCFNCDNVIDFYITSNALAFFRYIFLGTQNTLGYILNARCIIEGLAIKRYCKNYDSKIKNELLKRQTAILEYRNYSKMRCIIEYICEPQKLKNDYYEAVKYYNENLEWSFSKNEIEKIINSNIPFILNSKTNYKKLVEEQFGDEFVKIYGVLSQFLHPSKNDEFDYFKEFDLSVILIQLIEEEYGDMLPCKYTFEYHYNITLKQIIPKELCNLIIKEKEILFEISKVIQSYYKKNYISDTLISIGLLIEDMMLDSAMGLREQTKTKQKLLLDTVSVFNELVTSDLYNFRIVLLNNHINVQFADNIGDCYDTVEAYKVYLEMFPDGVKKELFDKSFMTVAGFLIDQKGNAPNLTQIVKSYISKFDNADKKLYHDIFMLDYFESQMISHANGYMFYANQGAWSDVYNILTWTDVILEDILGTLLTIYKNMLEDDEKSQGKTIINILRNGIKKIKEIATQKALLLRMPTTNISSLQ